MECVPSTTKLNSIASSIYSEPDTDILKQLVRKKSHFKNSMSDSSGIRTSDFLNLI